MRFVLATGAALAMFIFTLPGWAQSLTPIEGWIPLDSPKGKLLMRHDPPLPAYQRIEKPLDH
jgi:hypothetical protein